MDDSQLLLPTVDEYVRAFEAAEAAGKITPKQREMLVCHHSQPARALSDARASHGQLSDVTTFGLRTPL